MNSFKWIADGNKVYMVSDSRRDLFCTLSDQLLTPKVAAQETADALNAKFNS